MSNKSEYAGKVAIVTGAASGLGADAARAYAEAGANVALLGSNTEELKSVMNGIEKNGGRVIAVECDLKSWESVRTAVQTVLDTFGKIDILLNGGIARSAGESLSEAEMAKAFGTNVIGAFLINKHVLQVMKERGCGEIINISSAYPATSEPRAAKASAGDLTSCVSKLYSQFGISIKTIAPSFFEMAA